MTATTPVKKKNRRKKRKLHKGRLAIVILAFALLIIVLMAVISRACAETWGTRAGGDFRRPVPEAIEAGRRDAEIVIHTHAGSMERQRAMLDIRAKEYELRENGYAHAADDYINSATEYLNTHGIALN